MQRGPRIVLSAVALHSGLKAVKLTLTVECIQSASVAFHHDQFMLCCFDVLSQ